MASNGFSGLAIQDHIAAVRYVASDGCNVASEFASELWPIMLTRMVPEDTRSRLQEYEQKNRQGCAC